MSVNDFNREEMLELLKELFRQEPTLVESALRQILNERAILAGEDSPLRQQLVEKYINQDFDRFDDVFKALA